MKIEHFIIPAVFFVLVACDPGLPSDVKETGSALSIKGAASPLSNSEYDSLTPIQQYKVANKLLSTLFKGVSVDEFFDLSNGMENLTVKGGTNFLRDVRVQLDTNLDQSTKVELDRIINGDENAVNEKGESEPIEAKYYFDESRPKQIPMARIFEYPISRDMYSQWMSMHLANTILFSPAEEIDSADITDVQNLFRRLDISMMSGKSIRSIIATHQRSVENWRRFRSPEDNTREMIEIYLGLFDRDDDVPRASKACQDLYLTDENAGYKLAYTDYPNTEPQLVLGTYVSNCGEFYDVVAAHPLVIARVTSVLVDYFFIGASIELRTAIVESISSGNPETFEEIFTSIIFSKEYLLGTERPKSFEENFLSTASRMNWEAHESVFYSMTTGRGSLRRTNLSEMGWPTMTLKLGRLAGIPMDSLSFANYHKALRESLLLDRYRWGVPMGIIRPESPYPELPEPLEDSADAEEKAQYREELAQYNQELSELNAEERLQYDRDLVDWEEKMLIYRRVEDLPLSDLVDYLFLSVAERRASAAEKTGLTNIMESNGYLKTIDNEKFVLSWRRGDIAEIVMDFISRLPEIYYLKKI